MHDLLAELIERGRSTGGLKGPLNIGRFDLAPRERSGGRGTGRREPQGGGIQRKQAWRVLGGVKKMGKGSSSGEVRGEARPEAEKDTHSHARDGGTGKA